MIELQETHKTQNEKALELLDTWIADNSGYDEKVWPKLKETIETNRFSERKRFNDDSSDVGYGTAWNVSSLK